MSVKGLFGDACRDRTLRNFAAIPPLYKKAADSMMFSAGVSLMWGWLDHDL